MAKNETLEYLLEKNEDGTICPSITTAIWGDNDTIISNDNIVRMIQCGGYLLENQLMESDDAIEAWQEYYEMTAEQLELLKSIYDRKINNPHETIILTKNEIELIGVASSEGLSECMISFEEIGIYWGK